MSALRKLKRSVAHQKMKNLGISQVNKEKSGRSFFAKNWREVIN